MTDEQTAWEYLRDCAMSLLPELAEDNEYWCRVADFLQDKGDCRLKDLTSKQRMWLIDIREQLLEEARK